MTRVFVRLARRCLAYSSLIVLSACAHPGHGNDRDLPGGHGAVIEVRNDEFDDLVVYLVRRGTPVPLGVVPGATRRTFRVDEGVLGSGNGVELGAGKRGEPIQRLSPPFDLSPGRIATWSLRGGGRTEQPIVR